MAFTVGRRIGLWGTLHLMSIPRRMNYDDPYQDLHIHFEPGLQHLDGERALEYVRWRGDARADLARVERQRGFLEAASAKRPAQEVL